MCEEMALQDMGVVEGVLSWNSQSGTVRERLVNLTWCMVFLHSLWKCKKNSKDFLIGDFFFRYRTKNFRMVLFFVLLSVLGIIFNILSYHKLLVAVIYLITLSKQSKRQVLAPIPTLLFFFTHRL
jgi:hypothetical protein